MGAGHGIRIEEFTNEVEFQGNNTEIISKKLLDGNFLEYDMFVAEKAKNFIGRIWLYEKCDLWLKQNQNSNFLWINGVAGIGKSTFSANLFSKITTHYVGMFFCRYDEEITKYATSVIKAISYYLNKYYPKYTELIMSRITEIGFDELNAQKLFEYLIYMPTRKMEIPIKGLCITIDALDELFEEEQNELLSLFVKYTIPSWIKIIFTSRPESLIDSILTGNVTEINLESNNNADNSRKDIEQYVRYEIAKHSVELTEKEIGIIIDKSENNFLYIHYLVREVITGKKLNVKVLPKGLGALYLFNLRRKYPSNEEGLEKYNREAKPIFEIMVAAKSSITMAELSAFINIERSELGSRMRKLSSFVVDANKTGAGRSDGKKIYHRSFVEWLTSDQDSEYFIEKRNGVNKILNYLLSNVNTLLTNYYLKQCSLSHIIDDNRTDVMFEILKSDDIRIYESIEYELFYEYIERPKQVTNLIKDIENEKIRRILITTFRKALSHGKEELLNEIVNLLRYKKEFIRASMLEGEAFQWDKRLELAELKFNEAKDIAENEHVINQSLWTKRHIGLCYNRLGNLAKERGDYISSKLYYSLSYKMFSEIVRRLKQGDKFELMDSHNYEHMRDLMVCTARLGDIAFDENNTDLALKYYKEYGELCNRMLLTRETLEMKRRLAISMLRLGDVYIKQNKLYESYNTYSEALSKLIELGDDLSEDDIEEKYIIYPKALPNSFFETANIQSESGSIELSSSLPKENRELDFLRDLSLCYIRLGDVVKYVNNKEVALFWYCNYLGLCEFLYKTRQTSESEIDLQRAKRRKEFV